jgi:hypothetical protein
MATKTCSKCGITYELNDENYRRRTNYNNSTTIYYDSHCKKCKNLQHKQWYLVNGTKEYNRIKYLQDKQKPNYSEKRKEQQRKYRASHRKQVNYYHVNRRKIDPEYKLMCNIRKIVSRTVENKNNKSIAYIGCTIEEFMKHLQNTAINNGYSEFNIKNYSTKEYHVDHIIPISKWVSVTNKPIEKVNHYTNLQILSAFDNKSKGDKLLINKELT